MPSYLNIKEAADYLGISSHTLYKLVERSEVPAAKIGGSWRLSSAALDEFFNGKQAASSRSSSKSPELLIVEHDQELRRNLASIAMSRGAKAQLAGGTDDAELLLSAGWVPDLILYGVPANINEAFDFMQRARAASSSCRVAAMVSPERAADLKDLMIHGWLIVLPTPVERPDMVNLIASL